MRSRDDGLAALRGERLGVSVVFPTRFDPPQRRFEADAGNDSVTDAAEARGSGAVSLTVGRFAVGAIDASGEAFVFATVRAELPRLCDARECSIESTTPIRFLLPAMREGGMTPPGPAAPPEFAGWAPPALGRGSSRREFRRLRRVSAGHHRSGARVAGSRVPGPPTPPGGGPYPRGAPRC